MNRYHEAPGMTPGHCSACHGPAERGPSGAWWHTAGSCFGTTACRLDGHFVAGPPPAP